MKRKLISFSIPVLNEEQNLATLFQELESFAKRESSYLFEFVFTDNASTDGTWEIIKQKCLEDSRYKGIRFTKNIGFNNSILANFEHVSGEACIQFDADLQDPIQVASLFLRSWESGFKVVVGQRIERSEGKLINFYRKLGYLVLYRLSDNSLLPEIGDFKLLDREVVTHLLSLRYPEPYLRGIVAQMNFSTSSIPYQRLPRKRGYSKFSPLKLFLMGANALADHSQFTLRIIWRLFAVVSLAIFSMMIVYLWQALLTSSWPHGFLTIYLLLLLILQVSIFGSALTLSYLLKTYRILANSPRYYVEEKTSDFDK